MIKTEPETFTLDDLFALWQPTMRVPLHLSPDGTTLLINVQRLKKANDTGTDQSFTKEGIPREMVGSRVRMVETASGTTRDPFPESWTSWGAQWSPDGARWIAYVYTGEQLGLVVWERSSESYRLLPPMAIRPFFGFEIPSWNKDSQSVVVKLQATSEQKQPAQTSDSAETADEGPARVFVYDPSAENTDTKEQEALPGWANGYICNLARVDVTSGEVQLLAQDWHVIGWKVAPSRDEVAVLRYVESDSRLQQFYFDLHILPLDGSAPRVVARHIPQGYGTNFSWSPDSRFLAYTTEVRGSPDQLFVVESSGQHEPAALVPEGCELKVTDEYEPPLWSHDSNKLYCMTGEGCWEFARDGGRSYRSLQTQHSEYELVGWMQPRNTAQLWQPISDHIYGLVRSEHTKMAGLALFSFDQDTDPQILDTFPRQFSDLPFAVEVDVERARIYLAVEGNEHAAELWQFQNGYKQHRSLTILNQQLRDKALGDSRLITYRTLDGQERHAALLLPRGYQEGQQVPVIVEIYGGSMQSNKLHNFGISQMIINGHQLASRGFAVLYPDIPMEDRNPASQLPGLVLPAVQRLIDLKITEPGRIGLMGQSYGGYGTLALLTQSKLFSAAIACAGFSSLIGAYLSMRSNGADHWLGWCESGQGRMGGTLWEKRDTYIENSPIFYLDRVQTPLLLVCGTEDRGAQEQAEAVFVGLRRLKKPVELRKYQGEGHWSGTWGERSYRDLSDRILSWFDQHLNT
ncbi:hypothetical protein KDH_22970 [Dictyobacter sp. S3.2.2.5]|uniref:Peptidase S9 prolyl oligopeptidase catalytic domain-containing protein n=1 Tax=Dictyobacter halimunensis TaxID=3026934 RepID=A0ABQ6FMI3_9CHLR|nr:hypothetical protein KDH_22970 [Dictyobacter sp. S3.2.2.5]